MNNANLFQQKAHFIKQNAQIHYKITVKEIGAGCFSSCAITLHSPLTTASKPAGTVVRHRLLLEMDVR